MKGKGFDRQEVVSISGIAVVAVSVQFVLGKIRFFDTWWSIEEKKMAHVDICAAMLIFRVRS